GTDPGRMDIVPHRYEASIPDWRQAHTVADFVVKMQKSRYLLKSNPEAYFLEGAYVQQVMGRSAREGAKTFKWLRMGKKGPFLSPPRSAALERQFFYRPDIKARHAWGGALGNKFFWESHQGDMASQAKYLLRSLDDGAGLLLSPGDKARLKPWDFDQLPVKIRRDLVDQVYRRHPEHVRNELWMALETARHISKLKANKQAVTPETAFKETFTRYHKTLMGDIELVDGDEAILKWARKSYQKASKIMLMDNVLQAAKPRFKDWLAPDITEEVDSFDENGKHRKVRQSKAQIKKLQFAAFFELRDSIEHMDAETLSRLKRQNPDFEGDIRLLEKLIKKQKEMMVQPDAVPPADMMQRRRQAAEEVVDAFERLGKSRNAGSVLRSIKDGWAAGQALETYMQGRMVDALVDLSGPKYGIVLDDMRLRTRPTNAMFISPIWMSRMGKANSLITVLTAYARKGKVDEEVMWLALREGLAYVPVLGMGMDIQHGGLTATAQIVLTQVIPGYAPVMLTINMAKGVVMLGGEALFAPLKRDKIVMAYLGYLPKKRGGVFSTGRRERIWLPRKGLLYGVDPEGVIKMPDKRKAFFHWFRPRLVRLFVEKWGETPEEFVKGTSTPGESRIWAAEEGRYLKMLTHKYVHDWWEGTGEFAGDADVVVHTMMADHFSPEIKGELQRMLIGDYLDGKRLFAQEQEEKQQALQSALGRAANPDIGLYERFKQGASEYMAAMQTAGEVVMGKILGDVPEMEKGIEITAAPYVVKRPGSEGKEIYAVESIQFQAKVSAPSTEAHPAPFSVRFEIDAGEKAELDAPGSFGFDTEADEVTVVASVYDANQRFYFKESVTIPVTMEDDPESEGGLDDVFDALRELAERAEGISEEARARCNEAVALIGLATAGADELHLAAEERVIRIGELNNRLEEIKLLAEGVRQSHGDTEKAAVDTGRMAAECEKLSVKLCETLKVYRKSTNIETRKRLYEDMAAMDSKLRDLLSTAREKPLEVSASAEAARDGYEEMKQILDEFRSLEETERLSDRLTAYFVNLADAEDEIAAARAHTGEFPGILEKRNNLRDLGKELLKDMDDRELSLELEKDLGALCRRIEKAINDAKNCPDQAEVLIEPAVAGLERVRPGIEAAEDMQDKLLAAPELDEKATEGVGEKAELAEFLVDMTEGYFERIAALSADAAFCFAFASDIKASPLKVEVPNVEGMSTKDASRVLVKKGFRPDIRSVAKAKQPDLAERIKKQVPKGKTKVAAGSVVVLQAYGKFDLQEVLADTDCSRWPGSLPVWNKKTNRAECGCPKGMAWNKARTKCIDYRRAAIERTDCSRWPDSVPVWNGKTNRAECGCPKGKAWNRAGTKCIDYRRASIERADCSRWPGSIPYWNSRTQKVACGCPKGKVWNSSRTACVDRPPAGDTAGTYGGSTGAATGGTRTGGGGQSGGSGMSRIDCEKKYCPICGDDDIVLLGQSTDPQCTRCKKKYKRKIQACLRGDTRGSGNTYDKFKRYKVYQCLNRRWNKSAGKYDQWYTYHVYGPGKKYPGGETIVSCKAVTAAMTEVQAGFERDRLTSK
ncbi:MAG: PASTA domain-containing protein, partial [Deltaproteobacteria bacterium]|nr:PASTA domain-containing protein [Deltaproteobacteria bacterium]